MPEVAFDPQRIVDTLATHEVAYVVVGGVAARLHGSPTLTEDIDLAPERSPANLGRLATALAALDARLDVDGVPDGLEVTLDAGTFTSPVMAFRTRSGVVDVVLDPAGTGGYDRLHARAVRFEVAGTPLLVAALDDVIASKEAADRPKDRVHLPILRALRDQIAREAR